MLYTYSGLQNLKDNLVIIHFGLWKNVSVVPMVFVKVLVVFCFLVWVFFFFFSFLGSLFFVLSDLLKAQ